MNYKFALSSELLVWVKKDRRMPEASDSRPALRIYLSLDIHLFGQLASNQTYLLRLNALPIISASAAVGGTGRWGALELKHVPPEITWSTFVQMIYNC